LPPAPRIGRSPGRRIAPRPPSPGWLSASAGTPSSFTRVASRSSPRSPKRSSTTTSKRSSVAKTKRWGSGPRWGPSPGSCTTWIPRRTGGARGVPIGSRIAISPHEQTGSYVRSIRRTFQGLIPHLSEGRRLVVNVDGRLDYRVALKAPDLEARVNLRTYPNPKRGPKGTPRSPEAKQRDRAMFPVDQLHQLLRHSFSDHKRETISFGRRLESIIGRAHLLAVWKNFIKSRSERRPDRTTPAMRLGMTESR